MLLGWNGVGGTQRQALKLSAELRSLGVNTCVITRRRGGLSRPATVDDVGVYRVGWLSTRRFAALSFLAGAFVWMFRRRHAFQLIHAHNLPTALVAALGRPFLHKPVIVKLPNAVTIEEFRHRRFGVLRWFILRRYISAFVALNAEIEARLREKGVAAQRIVRIPNGVEPAPGRPSRDNTSLKLALGLDPDSKIVIYLGRLIPEKGVDWLLEAWKDVVREEETSRLLVVGDGQDCQRLRTLAHHLGTTGAVSFLGEQANVHPLLSISDILVLPSRSEGMSNALLEGMAHGLAVIATDVPGNREVIEDGSDGLLVRYGDTRTLTDALLAVLRDSHLRMRLGRDAKRKVESALSIRAVAGKYYDLYRGLVPERAV